MDVLYDELVLYLIFCDALIVLHAVRVVLCCVVFIVSHFILLHIISYNVYAVCV